LAELLYDTALHAQVVAPDRYGGVLSGADAVVFVPATAAAFRRRGFDHMEAIARPFCELSGVPLLDALVKYGHGDQRELGREERRERARGMYETVEDVGQAPAAYRRRYHHGRDDGSGFGGTQARRCRGR
ncbi:MAG: hypothetical protein ACLU1W_06190, partial [Collinsella sp.]